MAPGAAGIACRTSLGPLFAGDLTARPTAPGHNRGALDAVPQSAQLAEATLHAVGAAIGKISGLFYERMFAEHPVLPQIRFNRADQANGTQARALAGSIAVFASGLLAGQRPNAMLRRVAHRHVSVGVTSGQYALVHEHMLAAAAEVLDMTPVADARRADRAGAGAAQGAV
ncbi:hypothetical protein [Nocardia sp. NRRL S-836]|uniref:hypothetical protein n=1 Tax=Nocardia sp. NRRL S-836 TaxID=1519492 RepID=UPI0006ADDF26|nr:hypothetical protein [Nocardia sp. NRRL S-836]